MKGVAQPIRDQEEGPTKKPVDLYHLWWGSTHWRYAGYDESVVFNTYNYRPATIERGLVKYDSKLEVSTLEVAFARVLDPAIKFIAQNPVDVIWIEVFRVFPDLSPMKGQVIFIGQIKTVSISGLQAKANCVGFEYYLRQPVPIYRYGPQCNWTVFDSKCSLSSTGYTVETKISPDADKLVLRSVANPHFDTKSDGYFTRGYITWNGRRRMITDHVGKLISLRYPIFEIRHPATIIAYAGCDGEIETCKDKFDNVINMGGHPYIPLDNPTTWD